MCVFKLRAAGLAAVLGIVTGASVANATPVYDTSAASELTGSRSVGGGLTLGGGNATTATLGWTITAITGGYHYSYTLNTNSAQHSISHFILDLSDSCILGSSLADSKCISNVLAGGASIVPGSYNGSQSSNPGMPGTIIGVKFDGPTSNALPYTISFDSDRAPVYGDFYAKTGNPPGNGYDVFNTGLGNEILDALTMDFIARPDTTVVTAPEPGSLALLAVGMLGLGAVGRRRQVA